jgi:UDP-N-acetylmuramate: L-alanyl-gamma-D-glutamyl-meso-diaminopimelate ligase
MNVKPGGHIHFMGICGTAMASLAGILKSMGFRITGSDQNVYPPMSTQLERLGIPIQQGYKKENLKDRPDLVIVGNVISKTNEEAQALLASDIPYTSLPKALGEYVIANRESIVIAGTHGKTTTTSLAAWVSDAVGLQAGFLIGGIPINYNFSFRAPKGNYFVIEGDEYDTAFFDKVPKFVHYKPKHVILTSIEFDHADIYADLNAVKDAFRRLLELIPADGTLIYNAEDENIKSLLKHCKTKKQFSYGMHAGDYRPMDRESIAGRNQFGVKFNGQNVADLALKIFGEHNTMNALSVFALAHVLKWPLANVLQGMASFQGVKRRQELLGEPGGVTVIEDFAHHPTAVRLTLASIRERFPKRRLIAVFEPRSATSRRKVFQKDYVEAFLESDLSFFSAPFDQSKIAEGERFSVEELVKDIRAKKHHAHAEPSVDALVKQILKEAKKDDVIILMSNGGFDGIYQKILGGLN